MYPGYNISPARPKTPRYTLLVLLEGLVGQLCHQWRLLRIVLARSWAKLNRSNILPAIRYVESKVVRTSVLVELIAFRIFFREIANIVLRLS